MGGAIAYGIGYFLYDNISHLFDENKIEQKKYLYNLVSLSLKLVDLHLYLLKLLPSLVDF